MLLVLVVGVLLIRATSDPVSRPEPPVRLAEVPGPDRAMVSGVTGLSVLYVSAFGHPTLVDLETGDRTELHISDDQDRLLFIVEQGRVVDVPVVAIESGGRAFGVVAERAVTPSEMGVTPMCGALGCSLPPMGPPVSQGGDIIRILSPEADADVAALFDPAVWRRQDGWMVAPETLGPDVRLPAPADHSAIYLIHQP